MRAAPWLAVLLIAVLLAPSALASHNMGHRYLVGGRLLDSTGMPLQNKNVEIILRAPGGEIRSSVIATTDCLGDFISWKGQRGTVQGNAPHGGGEIEVIQSHSPPYVNFHFHDEHLSNRLSFLLKTEGEEWTVGFKSEHRQSISYHQLEKSLAPTSACGGTFDQFNRTLLVRVFVASLPEMNTAEVEVKPRNANVTYEGVTRAGSTDFMSAYDALLDNVTVQAGASVQIVATDIGTKNVRLDEEDARFHRTDAINVVGLNAGGALDDLKFFGIFILAGGVLFGLWFASKRLKRGREERRLRQTSTRRRFRREGGGPQP